MEKSYWNVLLVDDDRDDYLLTRQHLSSAVGSHFRLEWVDSFERGLEACEKMAHDVYLIDYRLGSRDGLDLVRQAITHGCRAPIILLTGQGNYQVDIEAMKAGATDYLLKSEVTPALLERTIRYAIERKAAEEALLQAREELEQRVIERTQELALINEELREEITERERIEKALRESEKRFRTLAETTSSAIFIVQEGRIRYVNPAVKMITGYAPEELLGLEFWEIAHPAYRGVLQQRGLAAQWSDWIPMRYELKLLTKHGQERWVDVTAGRTDFDGLPTLVLTAFDITERDRAEHALQEAKANLERRVKEQREELMAQVRLEQTRLASVIEQTGWGIVVVDANMRVVAANALARSQLAQELSAGQQAHFLSEIFPDGFQNGSGSQPGNHSITVLLPGGARRTLMVKVTRLEEQDSCLTGAVISLQEQAGMEPD